MSTIEIRLVTQKDDTIEGIKIPDIVSMGIRDITWSPYSHVEFVLDPEWEAAIRASSECVKKEVAPLQGNLYGSLTLGARHSDGVRVRKRDYEQFALDDRFLVETTPEQKQKIIQFALAQVGKPYDTTAIFGILLHRDWREQDSWFCSELVAAAFESGGVPLLYVPQHVNRITPRDVALSVRLQPKPKV